MPAAEPLLADEYARVLRAYLVSAEEEELVQAYKLGRHAIAEELGVLDVVELHHGALTRLLVDERPEHSTGDVIAAAAAFLREALSPYEITHRGFREATDVMQRVVLFASVVCHELVTPLTSILVSAGTLEDALAPDRDSPEAKLLANIRSAAARLKARADDLTDLVAFEAGTFRLDRVALESSEFLRDVCERLEPEVTRAQMELEVGVPDALPTISADPDRLEQVVVNLVRNAVKYGADGQRVVVRARTVGQSVEIEIEDNGAGIAPVDQARIFEPYFRAHDRQREIPGLGLGLTLCRQIVVAHGGTIAVESEQEQGTLFRVRLPFESRALVPAQR